MRAIAPQFWEGKGDVRPASVSVGGLDQNYIAIRADVRNDENSTLNPYTTAYFSYVGLVLQSAVDPNLPLWFSRGISGVLSNTIVRNDFILIGPPIPWHMQRLRSRARMPLSDLIAVTRSSPEYADADRLLGFDAQSWALIHYLMFGDEGVHRRQMDQFATLIHQGADPAVALKEAFGRIQDLEAPLVGHINKSIFPFGKIGVDMNINRESFERRMVSASEAAATRASFHIAMGRTAEARALINEARKADPNEAESDVAEGLLLDRD